MKAPIFTILFILLLPALYAQVISKGIVYGQIGWQHAFQSYTDHAGNRYSSLRLAFDSGDPDVIIDSAGLPVTIRPLSGYSYPTNVILKYDSNGIYQYHLRFGSNTLAEYVRQPKLCFDAQDNIYVYFSIYKQDSVDLFHASGELFKCIFPATADSTPAGNGYYSPYFSVLAKLNAEGQYQWATAIENTSPFHYIQAHIELGDRSQRSFVNRNNEVTIQYDNAWFGHTHSNDTLVVTSTLGQQHIVTVSSRDVLFTFSPAGALLKHKEPFKDRLSRVLPDTAPQGYYRSVTDGINTYAVYRFHVSEPDTFRCGTPVPLLPGLNYILFKINAQDEVVWARCLGVDQYTNPEHEFHLDYSPQRRQLVVGFAYGPGVFNFTHNPALNGPALYTDIYVSTYDTSGALLWEKPYGGTSHETMQSLSYNHKTNQLTLVGTTQSDDFVLGKYVLRANSGAGNKIYVAVIDSTNEVYSAQLINSLSANMLPTDIGYPVTDHKGRTYISGWFFDSIQLACNTILKATHWIDRYNRETPDGFVLLMEPHTLVDTAVCRAMASPSARYVWDSAAVYFDTIPDAAGCDSVLLFRLKILNSKSSIDTAVCRQFTSLSRRYVWDSTGTYADTIPNVFGCDSVVTIKLRILQTESSIDSTVKVSMASLSGKYVWDSSATYRDTIANAKGCDSVVTVRLTVLQTASELDTAVCRELRSPSGKYTYALPGIYSDTVMNSLGGDSIITIKVKILQSSSTLDTLSCVPYTSPGATFTCTVSGTYYDTIPNAAGCDSVIRINYTRSSINNSFTKYTCLSYVSPSGKYTYSVSGVYKDTLTTPAGCDSIITIKLVVIPLEITVSKSNDIDCVMPHAQLLVTGGNTYLWRPSAGISDATVNNPLAKPDTTTLYRIEVKDSLGCAATDSIRVLVTKQPDVKKLANVFTPNNDGINDCLHLDVAATLHTVDMIIFNRWGTVVFRSDDPGDCWNGKDASGNELHTGVYFFVLKGTSSCREEIEQHGTVTLIR
ncbi:MAG: gliding motility-associated C-terminal domain-containing protein [Bacteroidota bacterium]